MTATPKMSRNRKMWLKTSVKIGLSVKVLHVLAQEPIS